MSGVVEEVLGQTHCCQPLVRERYVNAAQL